VPALAACVRERAVNYGLTPGTDKVDTGYHPFEIGKM